jgi:hypothetical protein
MRKVHGSKQLLPANCVNCMCSDLQLASNAQQRLITLALRVDFRWLDRQ